MALHAIKINIVTIFEGHICFLPIAALTEIIADAFDLTAKLHSINRFHLNVKGFFYCLLNFYLICAASDLKSDDLRRFFQLIGPFR